MAQVDEHVAELLALPIEQGAKVARLLVDSLDVKEADAGAEKAQVARIQAQLEK
jgi:hypothetical protein